MYTSTAYTFSRQESTQLANRTCILILVVSEGKSFFRRSLHQFVALGVSIFIMNHLKVICRPVFSTLKADHFFVISSQFSCQYCSCPADTYCNNVHFV